MSTRTCNIYETKKISIHPIPNVWIVERKTFGTSVTELCHTREKLASTIIRLQQCITDIRPNHWMSANLAFQPTSVSRNILLPTSTQPASTIFVVFDTYIHVCTAYTVHSVCLESAATLVQAFVTSLVDYCKLQRALNAAARAVSGSRKFERGLTHLRHAELHWLDVAYT